MSPLDIEPPSADGLVVRLDEVLADLAGAPAAAMAVANASAAISSAKCRAGESKVTDCGLHSAPHKIIITTPTGQPLPQPRARPAVAGAHDWLTEP
jgi:hypothetical protein